MVQAVSPCLARYVRGSAPLMGLISFLSRRLLRRVVIHDQARAAPYDLLPERALFRFGSDSVSPFDAARADPGTSASKYLTSGLALPGQIRPHPLHEDADAETGLRQGFEMHRRPCHPGEDLYRLAA